MRIGSSSVGKRLPDMPCSSRGRIGVSPVATQPRLHHRQSPAAVPTAPPTSPPVSHPPPPSSISPFRPLMQLRRNIIHRRPNDVRYLQRSWQRQRLPEFARYSRCCICLCCQERRLLLPPLLSRARVDAGISSAHAHPLAKYVEIAGLRVMEDNRGQVKIGYIVVNHSPADLPDLRAQITLSAAGKPVFEFPTTIPSIGPYESKDLTATVKTNLRPYELPDWQALKPTFVIKSEQ